MEAMKTKREGIQNRKAELEQKLKDLSQRLISMNICQVACAFNLMEDVKKRILLQLFGGTNKSVVRGSGWWTSISR
jgi:DNA replication licensing factor MCM4